MACANGEMQFHEAANIFPLDDENLPSLADDIRVNKQQVPIELMDGKVLDGRRRWLACKMAGVKPVTKEVDVADPVAYVLSLNLHRRHLNPSQLSMVGARAESLKKSLASEAEERKKSGKKNLGENFHQGRTSDAIGKILGVSGRTIDHATKVLAKAVPEVVKAVDEGRMAVSTAAILSSEPPEIQKQEISDHLKKLGSKKYTPSESKHSRKQDDDEQPVEGKLRGVGIIKANEAINCLSRIPKNDALRKRGFQLVTDWIRKNK